jgi:hypothetical protein
MIEAINLVRPSSMVTCTDGVPFGVSFRINSFYMLRVDTFGYWGRLVAPAGTASSRHP